MNKNFTPHEDREQAAVIQWAEYESGRLPGVNLIYAIPNGGSRNKIEAANLKRTGVKPGVPDLFLPVARRGCHGLYIEMKRREGGRLSENQRVWLKRLHEQGYAAVVCHGFDEAVTAIENYYK